MLCRAEVIEVIDKQRWLIHYIGWSHEWDEEVGPERIRFRRGTESKAGKPVIRIAAGIIIAVVAGLLIYYALAGDSPADINTKPATPARDVATVETPM
ncbi:MAG: hypothetical protein GY765_16030 [bacterium]|nr:hypothetical protein [bacterium]